MLEALIKVDVRTLDGRPRDVRLLGDLWRKVAACDPTDIVRFDFSNCGFLDPRAVVALGGMVKVLRSKRCQVHILFATMRTKVSTNLLQNGFARAMGLAPRQWIGNSIRYREDLREDRDGIVQYLEQEWLGRGWVDVSPRLGNAIVGQVWEIYSNAFEHSGGAFGVFTCGQHFPLRKELAIAISDVGISIPTNARKVLGHSTPGDAAMEWAMQKGTTSSNTPYIARGLGLNLLSEFIRVNNGVLDICSGDGRVIIDGDSERYQTLESPIPGTMVHVRLQCDGKKYIFADEVDQQDGPYF